MSYWIGVIEGMILSALILFAFKLADAYIEMKITEEVSSK